VIPNRHALLLEMTCLCCRFGRGSFAQPLCKCFRRKGWDDPGDTTDYRYESKGQAHFLDSWAPTLC
jgi:hypothetical protein